MLTKVINEEITAIGNIINKGYQTIHMGRRTHIEIEVIFIPPLQYPIIIQMAIITMFISVPWLQRSFVNHNRKQHIGPS